MAEDIDVNYLSEAINDKMDRDFHNIDVTATLPFPHIIAVQYPTEENNYTWYRKYNDGWVEQGGNGSISSASALSVTYPVEMANANYTLSALSSSATSTSASTAHGCHFTRKDTTGCAIIILKGNSGDWIAGTIDWQVSGMAAPEE